MILERLSDYEEHHLHLEEMEVQRDILITEQNIARRNGRSNGHDGGDEPRNAHGPVSIDGGDEGTLGDVRAASTAGDNAEQTVSVEQLNDALGSSSAESGNEKERSSRQRYRKKKNSHSVDYNGAAAGMSSTTNVLANESVFMLTNYC